MNLHPPRPACSILCVGLRAARSGSWATTLRALDGVDPAEVLVLKPSGGGEDERVLVSHEGWGEAGEGLGFGAGVGSVGG